jgi:hypothetical protein
MSEQAGKSGHLSFLRGYLRSPGNWPQPPITSLPAVPDYG